MFSQLRRGLARRLTHLSSNSIINHKFYFGQGGELHFDLTKRNYHISVETIWEDYCQLALEGLTGVENFTFLEESGVAHVKDQDLATNLNESIKVQLRVPEDYTFMGLLNGSMQHISGPVGRKMRSKPSSFTVIGQSNTLALGDLTTEKINLNNESGSIDLSSLTVQQAIIKSKAFSSKKVMISGQSHITADQIFIRSIIMFGKSTGKIHSQSLDLDSISGQTEIISKSVKIGRYYGGQGNISIKCSEIKDVLGIETGTGSIEFPNIESAQSQLSKVKLGRMHKGKLNVSKNMIHIV